MVILRKKILGLGVYVSEIAAAAAGNDYLAPNLAVVFEDKSPAAALAGFYRTEKPGRTTADNHKVELH